MESRWWWKIGRARRSVLAIRNDFSTFHNDIVGLYLNPPENAIVLCLDEKSQVQALDRTAPLRRGLPEKRTTTT